MRPNSPSATLLLGLTTLSLLATLLLVRFNASSLPPPREYSPENRFEFCESNAHRHLTQLAKVIGPRPTGSAANYQHAISYIVGVVRQLQREIDTQRAEHNLNQTAVAACRLRLDFEVQSVEGVHLWDDAVALSYANISNVLVRLSPTTTSTPDAPPTPTLLVSSHLDSAIGSPGAGDDGVAAASMLETLRVLVHRSCAAPSLLARNLLKFRHPTIFLFNNAEEMGLLGAHGFARSNHRWMQANKGEIGAFINLEGAGTRGKAMLFQTGPGNAWIADMYAASVPYPRGTVMAQDVFQSNVIPSDTDFRVYSTSLPRPANVSSSLPTSVPGIDLALIDNGFCYHTPRDSLEQVSPGTLQHMGDNLVALVSHFLRTREWNARQQEASERAIYYDLVGWGMVSYSETTSQMLHVAVVTAMVVQLTRWRLWTPSISLLEIVAGCLALIVSMVCGIGGALGIASAIAFLLPTGAMSWFSHPIIAVLMYSIPAQVFMSLSLLLFDAIRRVASQLYHHHLVAPRTYCRIPPLLTEEPLDEYDEPPEFDATILHRVLAALLFWALLLISGSVYRIGSTYLALWMTTALFIGANVVVFGYNTIPTHVMERPDELRGLLATLLLVLPPIALLLDSLTSMVSVFMAISGRAGSKPSPDLVVGGLAAVGSVLVGSVVAPILSSTITASTTRRLCFTTLVLSLLTAPLVIAIVSHDGMPYSHDNPKRLLLEHLHEHGTNLSHIAIVPADVLPPPSTRVIERMRFASDPCTTLVSDSPLCVKDAVGALPSFVSCPTVPALKPVQQRQPTNDDDDTSIVLVAAAEPAQRTNLLQYYVEQHSNTSWTLEIHAPDTLALEINIFDDEPNAPLMSWDALDSSFNGNFSTSPYTDSLEWRWYSLLPKVRPNNTDTSVAPTPLRARHTVGYNPSRKWIQRFIMHPNRLSNLTVRLWAFYDPSAAVIELQSTMPDWCVPISLNVVRARLSFGRVVG